MQRKDQRPETNVKDERDMYLRIAGHIRMLCQRQIDLRRSISEINLEAAVDRISEELSAPSNELTTAEPKKDKDGC